MRIEQLTVENRRMQGAERRKWYRRYSPRHLQAMSGLLTRTLARCQAGTTKRAIVLGAGACTELPLEHLVRFCESVVLVDVDEAGMWRGCQELPAPLHQRITLIGADITGGVSEAVASELRSQPWDDLIELAGPAGLAPLDAAAGCLERCAVSNPPVIPPLEGGQGFAIVISSLVLTQLFSLPLLDVLDTLAFHAPGMAALREAHPRYRQAARNFKRRVALAHITLLDRLLAPSGVGLFTSDVTGYLLSPLSGPHTPSAAGKSDSLPVLPADVLAIPEDLEQRFRVQGSPEHWQWLVSVPDATHPGRSYDVCGVVFGRL
ncbi:MAG: hypothetical protein ACLQUY_28955 [Ktedonobacterales bacterium]